MSADSGSVRNTLASQSSTSSSGSTTDSVRKRREYGKKDRKIVRILTVMAYIVSVSTAAVLLSTYYVFLWSPEPRNQKEIPVSQQYTQSTVAAIPHTPPSQQAPLNNQYSNEEEGEGQGEEEGPGKIVQPSFALSASKIDLKHVRRKKKFYMTYLNTNTKAYHQRQIPTPPSTQLMMTKILTRSPQISTTPISRLRGS